MAVPKGPNPKPREILFIDVVVRHDPEYERKRRTQLQFEFTRRDFYFNPRTSGPYQSVAFGFSNGFSDAFQTLSAVWQIANGFERFGDFLTTESGVAITTEDGRLLGLTK